MGSGGGGRSWELKSGRRRRGKEEERAETETEAEAEDRGRGRDRDRGRARGRGRGRGRGEEERRGEKGEGWKACGLSCARARSVVGIAILLFPVPSSPIQSRPVMHACVCAWVQKGCGTEWRSVSCPADLT